MDYEKRYKEALETARDFLDFYKDNPVQAQKFIDIFPELAESEDERIINAIISVLGTTSIYSSNGCEKPEMIAWLEKQKEPQNKSMAHEDCSWPGILTSPLCKDKNLDDIAQEYVDGVRQHNPELTWDLMQTAVCYGYHLAENRQKPAEGSEKDEDNVDCAINLLYILDSYIGDDCTISQEETEVLRSKIQKELCPWLKSLRPSWKPSEEQMEALEYVIRDYREDSCNATANYLQEILDHLKNM